MALEQSEQNSDVASAATIAVTLPGAVLAGSRLVAILTWGPEDATPTLDDGVNVWEEIGTHFWNTNPAILLGLAMYEARNVAAGSTTVIASFGGARDFRGMIVAEVSGLNPTAAPEDTDGNGNATAGSGTDNATSMATLPLSDNAVLIGGCVILVGGPTMAEGTDWSPVEETPVVGGLMILGMEIRTLVGTPASTPALWSVTDGTDYHARVAAFAPFVAAPGRPWVE